MLSKRRITVLPVDEATFCGNRYGRHIVVFVNGADHPTKTPVPTEDPPKPTNSSLLVHGYGGALVVDATLKCREEYALAATASDVGLAACLVCPISASHQCRPHQVSEDTQKVVFFVGRERVAEVLLNAASRVPLGENLGAAVRALRQFPMQCLSPYADSVAGGVCVLAPQPHLLVVCTPHVKQVRTISLPSQDPIVCLAAGRVGHPETTVLLASNTLVLYGYENRAANDKNKANRADVKYPVDASSHAVSTPEEVLAEFTELLTCQLPLPAMRGASPCKVTWAGEEILWVVYADGTVCAMWLNCSSPATAQCVFTGKLNASVLGDDASTTTSTLATIHICPDARSGSLYYCYTTTSPRDCDLHYGCMRLHRSCCTDAAAVPYNIVVGDSLRFSVPFGEHVYGLRFDSGRYHLLTQSTRAGAPLHVTTLPRGSCNMAAAALGVPATTLPQCRQVMCGPEAELAAHCRSCEATLAQINEQLGCVQEEADVQALAAKLLEVQRNVYALVYRSEVSSHAVLAGLSPLAAATSTPHRLLKLVSMSYMQVATHLLLLRTGALSTGVVDVPLLQVLQLPAARERMLLAQEEVKRMVTEGFNVLPGGGDVAELGMWPTKVTFCVDVLLAQLGKRADEKTTLRQVLAEAESMTTALALLVVYCSYHTSDFEAAQHQQQPENRVVANTLLRYRTEFLRVFNHPAELAVWGFAAYTADQGVNPSSTTAEDDSCFIFALGPATYHLGMPPVSSLLPALLNALVYVAAFDVAFHLIGISLATLVSGGSGGHSSSRYGQGSQVHSALPVSAGLKLLYVALQSGCTAAVEVMYAACRGTTLERLATQALAYAALQSNSVRPLQGYLTIASPQERDVEEVLWAAVVAGLDGSNTIPQPHVQQQKEHVLLRFYILSHRYADALYVCRQIAAHGEVAAQRVQVVSSYLRSLLPRGDEQYLSLISGRKGASQSCRIGGASSLTADFALNSSSSGLLPVKVSWAGATVGRTGLESAQEELNEQIRRTVTRCSPGAERGAATARGLMLGGSTPANSVSAAMRPSAILSSVDRSIPHREPTVTRVVTGSEEEEEQQQHQTGTSTVGTVLSEASALSRDATLPPYEQQSYVGVSSQATSSQSHQPPQQQRQQELSRLHRSGGFASAPYMQCEAVLQRSGKVCGRARPCKYHDRK